MSHDKGKAEPPANQPTTEPTISIGGKTLVLRPATREQAREAAARVMKRHAVALANLKDR